MQPPNWKLGGDDSVCSEVRSQQRVILKRGKEGNLNKLDGSIAGEVQSEWRRSQLHSRQAGDSLMKKSRELPAGKAPTGDHRTAPRSSTSTNSLLGRFFLLVSLFSSANLVIILGRHANILSYLVSSLLTAQRAWRRKPGFQGSRRRSFDVIPVRSPTPIQCR